MNLATSRLNPSQYLISPAQDFAFICGSALFGYAAFLLMAAGVLSITPIAFVLLFFLEGTHLFSTATRSFLDPWHRSKIGRKRLLQLLPLFLIAPAFFAVGAKLAFFTFLLVWLHMHISKQHVGFLALYKRKAGEFDDIAFETKFYKVMMYAPVIFYLLSPVIKMRGFIIAGSMGIIPALWYGLREYERRPVSAPKLALVGLTVPLQWLAFGYAVASPDGAKVAGAILAFSHVLQYHRLNMAYHQEDAKLPQKKKVWHTLAGYFLVAFVLNFGLWVVPKFLIDNDMLFSPFYGFLFVHYRLDGWIWKTKDFPIFAKSLKLA